jgi:hypothetical protein
MRIESWQRAKNLIKPYLLQRISLRSLLLQMAVGFYLPFRSHFFLNLLLIKSFIFQ